MAINASIIETDKLKIIIQINNNFFIYFSSNIIAYFYKIVKKLDFGNI